MWGFKTLVLNPDSSALLLLCHLIPLHCCSPWGTVRDAISLLSVTGTGCPECKVQSCCWSIGNVSAGDWVRLTVLFCSCSTHRVVCWSGRIPASLSLSFKSWGWHTVRLMSLPCSETLFWIFRWLRQWLCLQLSSGYDLKIFLAIMKVCLACLCVSLTLAFSSPCTISMYQETLEKQIYTPLEAMLCCWGVWKKWVRIFILI